MRVHVSAFVPFRYLRAADQLALRAGRSRRNNNERILGTHWWMVEIGIPG